MTAIHAAMNKYVGEPLVRRRKSAMGTKTSSQSRDGLRKFRPGEGAMVALIMLGFQLLLVVAGGDNKIDATAHIIVTCDYHPLGLAGLNHGVEDDIGHVFVEVALVPEGPEELLDGLGFQALLRRRIFYGESGKIRLTGERAQGGELCGGKFYGVVIP